MRSIFAALSFVLFTLSAAQAQTGSANSSGFEKKNFNYSEWTKGLFSEVVTVTHPGKMIFLAGVGAEDENGQRGIEWPIASAGVTENTLRAWIPKTNGTGTIRCDDRFRACAQQRFCNEP